MISDMVAIRTHLLAQPAVTNVFGTRIWVGSGEPPTEAGYKPSAGAALVINRTSIESDANRASYSNRYQFKIYAATPAACDAAFRALVEAFNLAATGTIMRAMLDSGGQVLQEPDSRWIFSLSFWRVLVRDTTLTS